MLGVALSLSLSGQAPTIPIYDTTAPCLEAVTADSSYYEAGIGEVLAAVREPGMDYYAPVPRAGRQEALLIIPGGGYTVAAFDHEGTDMGRYFSARGVHAFVLRYRLPAGITTDCKSTVALQDAQAAILRIRQSADSLGYRADRVGVMGFSAGGHLAGSLSVHARQVDGLSTRPDFSLLVYPVVLMDTAFSGHRGSQHALLGTEPDPDRLAYFNLPDQIDSLTPPTILFHASDDVGVRPRNSLRYYERLIAHGVPADLRLYANGDHGFASARELDGPVSHWLEEAVAWITQLFVTR
ncbi:hypothetical protein LEM8419_01286 [Neolewinella maritima]|uniref:Alpha/beta hydrolase fold-3 domain-containing protein n=2 Tax=Neolewinella maritima TaxID=1383882 RepID=A0ABN8F6V2_9BACT|nr:hypothetical protein LEM8419_01286 [Neolewinella maritima]